MLFRNEKDTCIVFDTETTGLPEPEANKLNKQPYIIEIYCAKINSKFEIVDEFESLIKVPVPVSEFITELTGISQLMLDGTPDLQENDIEFVPTAPEFIEIYDSLYDFFEGVHSLVAHHLSFDHTMLKNDLKRHKLDYRFPWPKEQVCTVEGSFSIENKNLKLARLYKLATGETMFDAHRAKADVLPTIKSLHYLVKEGLIA